MISADYIDLHIAQLNAMIGRARTIKYDTTRINAHIDELEQILLSLNSIDVSGKTEAERIQIHEILTYVSNSLKYIVNSTDEGVHLEVYFALRAILESWIKDSDKYIFVSIVGEYCISWQFWNQSIYDTIKNVTGIELHYKLVPFSVPAHLQNDYLCNCTLYHELGHFVDVYGNITHILLQYFKFGKLTLPLIPYFANGVDVLNISIFRNYLMEYFADLFAAQYLGKASYSYIANAGDGNDNSNTHPATATRIQVVDDFVDGKDNAIVNQIQHVLSLLGLSLKNSSVKLDLSCFYSDTHYKMVDSNEVHGLISEGWIIWTQNRDRFRNADGTQKDNNEIYNIINRNIQKSVDEFRQSHKP